VRLSRIFVLSPLIFLAACASRPAPAPIVDGTQSSAQPTVKPTMTTPAPASQTGDTAGRYQVKKGDTLYRIALENGVPYRDLMSWNQLSDPNIKVGQWLLLAAPVGENGVMVTPLVDAVTPSVSAAPLAVTTKTEPKTIKAPYTPQAEAAIIAADGKKVAIKQQTDASQVTASQVKPVVANASAVSSPNPNKTATKVASSAEATDTSTPTFGMPTTGKVLRGFSDESKGVDIAGKLGQSIVASAQGKVVYAGAGLRGYGKMVILQHSNGYLTAYAHNDKLLVKEGDVVKKGEKIAEMGSSDTDQVKLHFEIRKSGKPVDPGKFIATEKP
jgi:lipoprotein NlpD